MKKYKIATTKDILNAVTKDNMDGFLKDFQLWLTLTMKAKSAGLPLDNSTFTWIDDEEYGVCNNIEINIKHE